LTVLTERGGTGRAEDFTPVKLPGDFLPGELRKLAVTGHDGHKLIAAQGPLNG
jgi:threonylcarbamoyladenosine tRNA methylthiotransferase MtaB